VSVVDLTTGEVLSGDVIEELDAAAARALTDRINHSTMLAAQLVVEAWEGRAWKSLGYRSWEDYADAELPLLGSTPANRHVLLVGLRKVGMSVRAISATTGLGIGTVHRHTSGVPNGTPDTVTGTDGKQYDPSHPSRIRRSETVEFAGEAGTGDSPAMSSGGPSPAFDPGEAALGDDADTPSPFPSPGSPIDVELNEAAPSTPVEADGTARPDASTGPPALVEGLANAAEFFATFSPDDIHQLDNPELTATVEHLIAVARNWANEFETTQPHGLTVIEGGRQ